MLQGYVGVFLDRFVWWEFPYLVGAEPSPCFDPLLVISKGKWSAAGSFAHH